MSLFNGKEGAGSSGEGLLTVVGSEAYFQGMLTVKGSLRVEGTIEGDISDALSVEVAKGGRIKGNISAETLAVAGEVAGEIVISRHIELLSSGRLSGKIRTPKLRIEDGAVFDGQCVMTAEILPSGSKGLGLAAGLGPAAKREGSAYSEKTNQAIGLQQETRPEGPRAAPAPVR